MQVRDHETVLQVYAVETHMSMAKVITGEVHLPEGTQVEVIAERADSEQSQKKEL